MTQKKRSYLFILCLLYFFLVFYIVFLIDYRLKDDFYGSINMIPFYKFYKFIFNYEDLTIANKVSFLNEFFGNIILLFPFAETLVFPQQKVTINNNIFIYQNKIESFTRDDSGLIPTTRMWRYKTA